MGCPDWPKCFGSYIPPISENDLPEGYIKIFADKRIKKTERLAATLKKLGFVELATDITSENTYKSHRFNAFNTWVEYLNRLLGAVVGLLVMICLIKAIRSKIRYNIILSTGIVILTGIQGWIGSIVVSTNLLPGMITVHMIIALVIIGMMITLYSHNIDNSSVLIKGNAKIKWLAFAGVIAFGLQIILGTRVREGVDMMKENLGTNWKQIIEFNLINGFVSHRSFSWLLVFLVVMLIWLLRKEVSSSKLRLISVLIAVMTAMEVGFGASMAYFQIPAFLQPLHLLFASVIFGMFYYLMLNTKSIKSYGS